MIKVHSVQGVFFLEFSRLVTITWVYGSFLFCSI